MKVKAWALVRKKLLWNAFDGQCHIYPTRKKVERKRCDGERVVRVEIRVLPRGKS